MGGCWGKCDLVDDQSGIFLPLSKRCCTDMLCLLVFLVYLVAMIAIGALSLTSGNIDYLIYPQDYLNQFCGKTIPLQKAYYPRLAQDLQEQSALFLAGPIGFYNFRPYTLCVDQCPPSFTLADPAQYGGPSYPGAAADAPSFYNLQPTDEFFNRCLPRTDTQPGLNRQLCGTPSCNSTALATCLGFTPQCTVGENAIESTPDVTSAWYVDVSDPKQVECCEFQVMEVNTQAFLPPGADAQTAAEERQFAAYISSAFGVMDAMQQSMTEILVMGLAAPFVCAMVWFVLLFLFAGLIIILALLLFLLFLVALTFYLYYMAGIVTDLGVDVSSLANFSSATSIPSVSEAGVSQLVYTILAILFTVLTFVYVIFLCLSREAIGRCIAIVREVTKVFFALPFMTIWPLVGVGFYIAVLVYMIGVGGFILTQGVDANTFQDVAAALNSTSADSALDALLTLSPQTQIIIMFSIHIVGCIWALFITQAATYMTLSRSAAVWFFNHGPNDSGEIVQKGQYFFGTRVVLACAWCVISRHMGSVAFGAAVLTIITIIRLILQAIDYYTKDLQGSNLLLRIVIKCAQCCLWCLDKTVRFITYYGFIFVAIEGSNFCTACLSTFSFIMKYPAQMSVNRMVANLLSCVISLSIPMVCGAIGFVWIDQTIPARPQPTTAAAVIMVIAFVIASAITDVFRCCIDTIFVCAFKDLEEKGPKYMSKSLRSGFGLDDVEPGGPKLSAGAGATSATDDERT